MDQQLDMDATSPSAVEIEAVETASAEYLGRWNRLVSTTNWEKGRIIAAWRGAMVEAGATLGSCTDEAWSRRVGNVSPQHVGRLRRVYERFGEVREQYAGLFWSHFQAALDWPDAEMWLEGAVQSGWSISHMRQQRWQALGGPAELQPRDEEIVQADYDEDVADDSTLPPTVSESFGMVCQAQEETGDGFDANFDSDAIVNSTALTDADEAVAQQHAVPPIRPFEDLAALPADLNEAFELFKLAVLNHKVAGWREVSRENVLAALEALKQLALAPA